jgi:hypothetical protein
MSPDIAALVRRLRGISEWSGERCAQEPGIITHAAQAAAIAIERFYQERRCSTCRHICEPYRNVTGHMTSGCINPLITRRLGGWQFSPPTEDFGCSLWEPLAPETKGEMTK